MSDTNAVGDDESASDESEGDLQGIITAIDSAGALPAKISDPAGFLLWIYSDWVDRGGFVAGKVRNSVRQLVGILGSNREIKSIRPKLNGLTRLPRRDAETLLKTILENWQFDERAGKGVTGYTPFAHIDIDGVTKTILDATYPPNSFEARRGILLPDSPRDEDGSTDKTDKLREAESTSARSLIPDQFAKAQTLITVSQQRTIIGRRSPAETIQGFASTIDTLWQVDEKGQPENGQIDRILVWVLDMGNRDTDLDDSYRSFFNLDFLASQFRALRIIRDDDSDQRWGWLDRKAVFLVGKLTTEEVDRLYSESGSVDLSAARAKWQNVDANHVSLGGIPSVWAPLRVFRDLYGRNLENVEDRTYTIFAHSNGGGKRHAEPLYFGYAPGRDGVASGRKLPSPGENYTQAANIIDMAARFRLRAENQSEPDRDKLSAVSRLRQIGFAVLRLSEFLNISKDLIK